MSHLVSFRVRTDDAQVLQNDLSGRPSGMRIPWGATSNERGIAVKFDALYFLFALEVPLAWERPS